MQGVYLKVYYGSIAEIHNKVLILYNDGDIEERTYMFRSIP